MKLTKQSMDTKFTQLLERWVSSDSPSERAVILKGMKEYNEDFSTLISYALGSEAHEKHATRFLLECDDAIAQSFLAKQTLNIIESETTGRNSTAICTFVAFLFICIFIFFTLYSFYLLYVWLFTNPLVYVLIVGVCISARLRSSKQSQVNTKIVGITLTKEDPRLMGITCRLLLLDIYTLQEAKQHGRLHRLLPQVTKEDKAYFPSLAQRDMLRLAGSMPVEVSCLLLQTLERVGDPNLLPALRRLSRTTKSPAVAEAALHCLEALQASQNLAQEPATLLRASNATEQTDTLLRPAQHTNDDDTNQLLRPR